MVAPSFKHYRLNLLLSKFSLDNEKGGRYKWSTNVDYFFPFSGEPKKAGAVACPTNINGRIGFHASYFGGKTVGSATVPTN
jgi:hypothetical protein